MNNLHLKMSGVLKTTDAFQQSGIYCVSTKFYLVTDCALADDPQSAHDAWCTADVLHV